MGEGDFIKKPDRRFRLLLIIQVLWVATLIVLTLWWGTLIKSQGDEIANLQVELGIPESQAQSRLDKTIRMIEGESGSFALLILITNGILLFFFARDTKRSRSLEAFFASITHELRTPLTSIRLQAEALKDIEDNPKHQPYIQRLLEDASRLEHEVQQTLELARVEGGGTLTLQTLRAPSFIQNKILPDYQYQSARVLIQTDVEPGFILADPTALTIIFRNLVDNAIKYSDSDCAKISLTGKSGLGTYEFTLIHLNSQFSGDLSKLGKLFYRGENSKGAGVGLYLIKTLVSKMKGRVDFTQNVNTFTTTITLPLDPASEVTHA